MHEAADAPDASLGLDHDLPGSLCRPLHELQSEQSDLGDSTFMAVQVLQSMVCKEVALSLTFHRVLTTGSVLVGTSSAAFSES